jgi:hypothetical protein
MESLMEGCPECALIAKVREDERAKWSDLSRDNWQDGYEQGLAAAVAAVEGLWWDDYANGVKWIGRPDIIAAIKGVADGKPKLDT